MTQQRLARLQEGLAKCGLAALALNAGPSLGYLTGLHFHLSERPVLLLATPRGKPLLILPELEAGKLAASSGTFVAHTYGEDPATWGKAFAEALADLALDGGKIGVEPRQMRLLEYEFFRSAGAEIVDGSSLLAALRARKDAAEIAALRQAVRIAEEALIATLPQLKIGLTEKEIATELLLQLFRHGSESSLPFPPIVSAGPNAANPHARPSNRPLAEGDLLVVDWGASFAGYFSDLTRTFAVGRVDAEARAIHQAVLDANRAGRLAGGPGVACAAVDRAARCCIEAAGYGPYFIHRTGHGLGIECHEEPYIRGDNQQLLAPGMVYTVEPGVYLPGRNGVRLEDDVLITASGAETLSGLGRELVTVG
jgi:Xaa-Pro dipeptidase